MKDETVIFFGGEVKALGDGKVAGQLITFGDAMKTDLELDFFDKDTDYDVDFSSEVKSTLYYNHGLDTVIGKKKLGGGIKGTLKTNDVGIWIEAQLDMRNEYERAIYKMTEEGKMGWSSGTAAYLVEREQVGKAMHIKKWTLGIDASLTPTPAEHRNSAIALKSAKLQSYKSLMGIEESESILGENVIESVAYNALCGLVERFMYCGLWNIIFSDFIPSDQKIAKIDSGWDELAVKGKQIGAAILALSTKEQSTLYTVAKSLYFDKPEEKKFKTLNEHITFVKSEVSNLENRLDTINEVSGVKSGDVKVGASFNATNKQYIKDIATKLCDYAKDFTEHGDGLMKMVEPSDSEPSDDGKSINALELKLIEHSLTNRGILRT